MHTSLPSSQKHRAHTGLIFILLLIAIVLAACIFIWKVTANNTQDHKVANEQKQSIKTQDATVESENWRTYTNANLGISFEYPADYEVVEGSDFIYVEHKTNKPSGYGNIISANNQTIEELLRGLESDFPLLTKQVSVISINEVTATKIDWDTHENLSDTTIYISNGGTTYAIRQGYGDTDTFTHILETLTFL